MTKTVAHYRGTGGDISAFAPMFIAGRMEGFEKDMRICLTAVEDERGRATHAYLPALAACCGTLEYLTGLHRGNVNKIGWEQIADFAQNFLPQPDFNREVVRILVSVFRHPIMHRGIASGVWVDKSTGPGKGRRLTWQISADAKRPSCQVIEKPGTLKRDPPWACAFTHLGHVHLRSLWTDIRGAASAYSRAVAVSEELQKKFETCMKQLYPL